MYTGVGFSIFSKQELGLCKITDEVAFELEGGGIDDGASEINTLEAVQGGFKKLRRME